MTIRTPLAVLGVALLLCACAKDNGRASAAESDSAAAAAQTAGDSAATPASTGMGGIGGVPDYARRGVDSSNAMQQQRVNEINGLSDQASGTATP